MSFNEVIGQALPVKLLKNMLSQQQINHAYLFAGPAGVGKEFVAKQFIKALNCTENELDACEKCISCRKFASNNHPDVIEITPEGKQIKIDQIREIQQNISYKPYESDWKVYLFKEAEKMNLQAANSLLRILEEPPAYAIIILLTLKEELLLPTITSRCQIIRFRPLKTKEIKNELINRWGLSSVQAERRALLAGGSLGRAVSFTEDDSVLTVREEVLAAVKKILDFDIVEIFEFAQQLLTYKENLNYVFEILITFYRDLLIYKQIKSLELVINFNNEQELLELSSKYRFGELEKIIKLITETAEIVKKTNVNLQLALEVMLLKIKGRGEIKVGRDNCSRNNL
ncbi:DNA polymerase III subunit delta' [Fuchsiella alkaliacetigena]|uniref:DNA polymerase III subunit delta' n=1 Tax=Fuchsiella alkaliacetigena TaxID=957042 RepID=UPI00200B3EDC|nr:DNA polymerase III subunit delta' [Fuchsiella alkaliacetigena]MCK8824500.1 DNA polymerase III subunit delta' [Fuchsiella alkaliacetigena]